MALSTQEELKNKQARNEKFSKLKSAVNSWLTYNRKVLNSQVTFLNEVKKRRGDKSLTTAADNIKPLLIKNLRDFLSNRN